MIELMQYIMKYACEQTNRNYKGLPNEDIGTWSNRTGNNYEDDYEPYGA